jgi:hypothetical protein
MHCDLTPHSESDVRGLARRGMADASSVVYVERMEGSRQKFRSAQILEVRTASSAVDTRCSLSLIDARVRACADITERRQV